jgi:hypothetical protein
VTLHPFDDENLLDTEKPNHCPVCGVPLDPYSYAQRPWDLIPPDNLKWNKCWDCRKFVPDLARSVARFWKELYDQGEDKLNS